MLLGQSLVRKVQLGTKLNSVCWIVGRSNLQSIRPNRNAVNMEKLTASIFMFLKKKIVTKQRRV